MRILLAADNKPYSEYALGRLINLAKNTWADVTILGVHQRRPESIGRPACRGRPVRGSARPCENTVTSFYRIGVRMSPRTDPWRTVPSGFQQRKALFEEVKVFRGQRKEFKLRLRTGSPADQIVAESKEQEIDLVILGCPKGEACGWKESGQVPQEVVNEADCSVLVVKEEQPVDRILACLDQGYISQESLEMVNQMITIHDGAGTDRLEPGR